MTDEAVSALSLCRELKHLGVSWSDGLNDVLRVIGMKLSSLELRGATAEKLSYVAECCTNLEYLELHGYYLKDAVLVGSLNDGFKKRMKRLSSLKVNRVPVRLGTDWVGYVN
jgi:hypothetical protein